MPTEKPTRGAATDVTTDATGKAQGSIRVNQAGSTEVEASATTPENRVVFDSSYLWVMGSNDRYPLLASSVAVACFWLFCVDGNCVSIRVAEGEESPKRSIGRREKDGYALFHQLRVERIGIRCGDPKRHAPSQFARCIEVSYRCPDHKRDRFGVEDNRARWIVRDIVRPICST